MRRNKQYLAEIYKGTTFLRLFLFLSIGVVAVNTLGVAPLWMLVGGLVGLLMLAVCVIGRVGDLWMKMAFVLIAVAFGGLWSLRERPSNIEKGVRQVEITTVQRGSGGHLACDAVVQGLKVRINSDSALRLGMGEVIEAEMNVYWPRYRGGKFNYPLYLYRKGYSGVVWLDSARIISRRQTHHTGVAGWRIRCVERFRRAGISGENIGLISAMTVGERSYLEDDVSQGFRDAGVAHVLVVSGMHVGFIFLLINFLCKRIKKRKFVVCGGIAVMWGYALLVGMTAPVCRASFMFSMMLLFEIRGGVYRSIQGLSLSAILLLLFEPLIIYDVGFQMSYLAVLSIIIFFPVLPCIKSKGWIVETLWDAVRLSLSAQMLVTPFIIYYFGRIPIYSLLTNLMITLLTPVVFIAGIATLLPLVGHVTGWLTNMLLDVMRGMVMWVAGWPFSTIGIEMGLFLTIACLLMTIMIGNILRSGLRKENEETIW